MAPRKNATQNVKTKVFCEYGCLHPWIKCMLAPENASFNDSCSQIKFCCNILLLFKQATVVHSKTQVLL